MIMTPTMTVMTTKTGKGDDDMTETMLKLTVVIIVTTY